MNEPRYIVKRVGRSPMRDTAQIEDGYLGMVYLSIKGAKIAARQLRKHYSSGWWVWQIGADRPLWSTESNDHYKGKRVATSRRK